jgi:hypothetical protein
MALSEQEKDRIARELAQKRAVMGDTGFESYLGKLETAIPQVQQQLYTEQVESQKVPETKGVLGAISRFTGVDALARGAAAAINAPREERMFNEQLKQNTETQNRLIDQIKKNKAEGRDTQQLEKALADLGVDFKAYTEGSVQRRDLGVTNRQVIGSAIRTAGTIASAGQFGGTGATTGVLSKVTAPALTTATGVGRGVLQGAATGFKAGTASGAVFGGVSGLATGIEQNKGVLGTAFEVAKQGAVGSALGGAVGGVVGGAGGAFQAKSNRANELKEMLSTSDNVDDALSKVTLKTANSIDDVTPVAPTVKPTTQLKDRATAGFKVENGKVVADKKAQTLLKQGLQDTDVAIMQSFSPDDVKAAKEMVAIAKETASTGLPNQRQQEIVGKAFMQRAKDVEKLNKTAGGQIDDIARGQLAGKPVNAGAATDDFFNQLERDGVDIDALRLSSTKEEIAQAFEGSSFEGLDTVQRTLKTVLKRVDPDLAGAKMDGLALHRAKRFIDNQVTYGKNAEGLVGDAERLLKSLRTNIDDVLDTSFPDYNKANIQYKETIEALDEMRRLIGKDYLGSGNITDLKAGEAMTRLLGGATAKPMSALQNLENVSRKYGNTYSNSVMKQVRFADLLDDIYETVQKGSIQGRVAGGVAQGIDQSVGFMNRMRQGGLISAAIDTAGDFAKGAAGITPEARQQAVEAFLGLTSQ